MGFIHSLTQASKWLPACAGIAMVMTGCSLAPATTKVEHDSPNNQNWHDEMGWHPDYHDSMDSRGTAQD